MPDVGLLPPDSDNLDAAVGLLPPDFDNLDAAAALLARQILERGSLSTGGIELCTPAPTKPVDIGATLMLIRHRRWVQSGSHEAQYWAARKKQAESAQTWQKIRNTNPLREAARMYEDMIATEALNA